VKPSAVTLRTCQYDNEGKPPTSLTVEVAGNTSVGPAIPTAGGGPTISSDLIDKLNAVLSLLPLPAAHMNGNTNLRVDFGRILLMGPYQSGLRMEALLSVLNPHFAEGDKVLFTKIINRNRSDVEDIVNTKDVEGKPMWLCAAAGRIIYQFACMANEDMFFVDVGGSSSQLTYTIRKKKTPRGLPSPLMPRFGTGMPSSSWSNPTTQIRRRNTRNLPRYSSATWKFFSGTMKKTVPVANEPSPNPSV
jgi:hypothetical protein